MNYVGQKIFLSAKVTENLAAKRLDQAASLLFPQYSRMRLKSWIKAGQLTLDGKILLPRTKVKLGQTIVIEATLEKQGDWQAQDLGKLDIIYEDEDIIIVNKPASLVVHPAAGNKDRTLLNALLHHDPELCKVPRAGIIHRLDKDTSGLLIIARNLFTHTKLIKGMKKRAIHREYVAVVFGVMTGGGSIELSIGRHLSKRTLMAVRDDGKPALTHYWVIKRFAAFTYIRVKLDTGRTHQIRVHLAHIGYPIVGDKTYGRILKLPNLIFDRQALHAERLQFIHPRSGKEMQFIAPLPQDLQNLLDVLQKNELNK